MSESKKLTFSQITNYILLAIPLAMGIASVIISVLAIVQSTPVQDMTLPLGLGMACLAVLGLDILDTEDES